MRGVRLWLAGVEHARLIARLLRRRDAWRNLAYDGPPPPSLVAEVLREGRCHCLLIEAGKRAVGLFILYATPGRGASVEFDLVISSPKDRRRGLALQAIYAFEELMFAELGCSELWAWADAGNRPLLALVRAGGWPIVAHVPRGGRMADGIVDIVVTRLTRRGWRALRRHGRTLPGSLGPPRSAPRTRRRARPSRRG